MTIPKNQTSLVLDNFINVTEDHEVEVKFIVYNPNTVAKVIRTTMICAFASALVTFISYFLYKFSHKKRFS